MLVTMLPFRLRSDSPNIISPLGRVIAHQSAKLLPRGRMSYMIEAGGR